MRHAIRRARRLAGRGLLALILNGGWALLAALPVLGALFTWLDGLG